ncbi:MAG TPA: tetratricopeptide repeat protein [Gemmatimonadales bacterium]|nr:tetratricopeptide repeat protein [Gemmatimonadales bacterium]
MTRATVAAAALLLGLPRAALTQTPAAPAPPPPPSQADSLFSAGKYAEARARYDAFLGANPGSIPARVRAGYATLRLKHPDQAISYFDAAIAAAPAGRAPAASAGRAIAHAMQGDHAGALADLEMADSTGYLNFDLLDREEALAAVRKEPRFLAVRNKVLDRAYPCAANPHAREFDFWIGEWDAYPNGSSQQAGTSSIQRASGGCMILENWSSWLNPWGAPYEGKSMNFVEAGTGKWRQVWAGSAGDLTYFEGGEYRDGAMRFTYQRTNLQGQKTQGNLIFYNLGPNLVRQFQDVSTDSGKTRTVGYDFIYVRKGSGASAKIPSAP